MATTIKRTYKGINAISFTVQKGKKVAYASYGMTWRRINLAEAEMLVATGTITCVLPYIGFVRRNKTAADFAEAQAVRNDHYRATGLPVVGE